MKHRLAAVCIAIASSSAPGLAAEVHGETDVFKSPGASLAWAILRGADEERTAVVVRVVTDSSIRSVTVKGRDPFTRAEKVVAGPMPTRGCLEVRIPRATFADFPRTEWQLFGSEKEPRLVVFYLGVPDTTPELVDEKRLEAWLGARAPQPSAGTCPRN